MQVKRFHKKIPQKKLFFSFISKIFSIFVLPFHRRFLVESEMERHFGIAFLLL